MPETQKKLLILVNWHKKNFSSARLKYSAICPLFLLAVNPSVPIEKGSYLLPLDYISTGYRTLISPPFLHKLCS